MGKVSIAIFFPTADSGSIIEQANISKLDEREVPGRFEIMSTITL